MVVRAAQMARAASAVPQKLPQMNGLEAGDDATA